MMIVQFALYFTNRYVIESTPDYPHEKKNFLFFRLDLLWMGSIEIRVFTLIAVNSTPS
jgi:hypothetical protein